MVMDVISLYIIMDITYARSTITVIAADCRVQLPGVCSRPQKYAQQKIS